MQLQEIQDRVREHIRAEILDPAQAADLADDTSLIASGMMNSLSTLSLVAFLEETFGVELAAHEISIDCLDSVEAVAALVAEKLA
jgi:acyl carrier protein